MKKNYLYIFFLAALSFNFSIMKDSSDRRLRWKGMFPFIRVWFSYSEKGMNAGDSVLQEASVKKILENLFQDSRAYIHFEYSGQTAENSVYSQSEFSCTEDNILKNKGTKNIVMSASNEDTDCTAESCSFIYSCGDEFIHFDTVINTNSVRYNSYTASPDAVNFQSSLQRELLLASGLTYCPPGDTEVQCSGRYSKFSDTGTESPLYKFRETETVKDSASEDDRIGLKYLYSEMKTSLRTDGIYRLNAKDLFFISSEKDLQQNSGYNTSLGRKNSAEAIRELAQFVDSGEIDRTLEWAAVPGYQKGMKFRDYMKVQTDLLKTQIPTLPAENLEFYAASLAAGIITVDDWLNEDQTGASGVDSDLLQFVNSQNAELRSMMKEELARRGK